MKIRLLSLQCAILVLGVVSGFAECYTINIIPNTTSNAIANHLDNGNNTLNEVLATLPNGSRLLKWNCGNFTTSTKSTFGGNWSPNVTLSPGEGAFLQTSATSVTFCGTPHVPVLPAPLPCGCGKLNFLSRQAVGIGTYQNVTGLSPQEGAEVLRSLNGNFDTNTFSSGSWTPGVPTLNVGESAFFIVPCAPNPCPLQALQLTNTGVATNGVVLPDGSVDPHYTLTTNPNGGGSDAFVVSPLPGGWLTNDASSQWIGPTTDGAGVGGTYIYQITFNMTCTNNAIITGRWA